MTVGEPEEGWRVVLDANILLQAPMRDTLLRLAEEEVIAVFWSDVILAEVERNFAKVSGIDGAQRRFTHLLAALRRSFPRASIDEARLAMLDLPIAAHDRHVLACALVAPAEIIVTYNTRHFPPHLLAPYEKRAWHPDELLRAILEHRPDTMRAVLTAQGLEMSPPRTLTQVVERLARDVPHFAVLARARFGH
jgi:predicted nucleic acid-binding protein